MSQIEQILEDFGASISPVVVMGAPNKNPYIHPIHLQTATKALRDLLLSEAVYGYREPYINKRTKVIPIEAINRLFEETE